MLLDTTLHCYKKNVLPFFLLLSLLSTAVGRLRTVQYSTRYPYRHLQYSVLYSIQYIYYLRHGPRAQAEYHHGFEHCI
jgi:hypothetical protein